jgi:hypothetical protein
VEETLRQQALAQMGAVGVGRGARAGGAAAGGLGYGPGGAGDDQLIRLMPDFDGAHDYTFDVLRGDEGIADLFSDNGPLNGVMMSPLKR